VSRASAHSLANLFTTDHQENTMSLRHFVLSAVAFAAFTSVASAETIKVGVTPGPHAQVLEAAKAVAAKKGLDIQIVEFSDYVVPNTALDTGDLQANSFQHQPYLDNQVADRKFKLESVATTINFPMGIYSKKYKSWDAVPSGASIAIPNDPTNGGRVLLLLRDKGVIKLKDGVGFKPTMLDITDNPKKLKVIEVDAAQIPRTLPDVDVAGINTNYATQAGLDAVKDAILREEPKGPYANIIAVRTADKDKPWVKTLVESYHDDSIKAFINDQFKGALIPSW
jgi:D-methionine transport system substrate-binding protein